MLKNLLKRKPSKKLVEAKMNEARGVFGYVTALVFTITMLFLSTTVKAQTTQLPNAAEIADVMQPVVGIDFGGFMYESVYADQNTVVMVMLFTDLRISSRIELATSEELAKLSRIFNQSFTKNPQLVSQMKEANINMRVILKTTNKIVFDETIYVNNL